jgi:hypothetical protein
MKCNLNISFNLSHCDQGVVRAISEYSVGVDIQNVIKNLQRLIATVMCEEEKK